MRSCMSPKTFSSPRKSDIISMGGKVVEVDGAYEDALKKSAEDAYRNHWYNANTGRRPQGARPFRVHVHSQRDCQGSRETWIQW